jgi:hypothetical protein
MKTNTQPLGMFLRLVIIVNGSRNTQFYLVNFIKTIL